MSNAEIEDTPPSESTILEAGTYEILQSRLKSQGSELAQRLQQLNAARKEVFGSIETTLQGTERISTSHNCIPRDMVAIGNRFLFGYNVHLGLKSEMELGDVFAIYEFEENTFHSRPIDLIHDDQFRKDFQDVYRYYREATFSRFDRHGPFLYMVFQVGKSESDIKTFKWQVNDESLSYVDNRSDHEVRPPAQHEFEWVRVTRDQHRAGLHPHVSIEDLLFVETIGGDLTIKVENNTESGAGIYSEPVDLPDQTLDDADIHYAVLGNLVLLQIRPYQETASRYFVFNIKLQHVLRLDSLALSCLLLPDDQGLIFFNGYYLQNGEYKTFDHDRDGMQFKRKVAASNGEDYLFVFHNTGTGEYILLNYNLIEQHVTTPLICHGFTLFDSGELICFRAQDEPQKHHALQIWRTPFVAESDEPEVHTDSFLYRIGNREIVRGMAECREIIGLVNREETYASLFIDLVKKTNDLVDAYFWLDREEAFRLKETLLQLHETAKAAVGEFEKVAQLRKNTSEQTARIEQKARELVAGVHRTRLDQLDGYVTSLADLRSTRGEVISLRDLRYVDLSLVEQLEGEISRCSEQIAQRCVEFLLRDDSLDAYRARVAEQEALIPGIEKTSDAKKLEEQIGQSASELEMLIEIVGNLKIDDATQRTEIVEKISVIFSTINTVRATLKQRTRELLSTEGIAEFNSQLKLLNQGVVNYLDLAESPEKCDEFLTRLMVQVEELEGRFAEFDEFLEQLTEKREEIYNAFENRKLTLLEARNKRASALQRAADRILNGIRNRIQGFDSINEINGYFASDLMIEKVRDIIEELETLEDSVKVDDIQSRLKATREDSVRQLKDRQELFVDGQNVIRFGEHQFSVNVQPLDLTTVLRDEQFHLHLTGTDFFEAIARPELEAARDCWSQEVVSENDSVYRSEYLAYQMLKAWRSGTDEDLPAIKNARSLDAEELRGIVSRFMGPRYEEGYTKGVHDEDATLIVQDLLQIDAQIGLLRFSAESRAAARVFWTSFCDSQTRNRWEARCRGFGRVAKVFPETGRASDYRSHLQELVRVFCLETGLFPEHVAVPAGDYLFEELCGGNGFVISQSAARIVDEFHVRLKASDFDQPFSESREQLQDSPSALFELMRDWSRAFIGQRNQPFEMDYADEVACLLVIGELDHGKIIQADPVRSLNGLKGSHGLIESGSYSLNYNRFMDRLGHFEEQVVSRFRGFVELKKRVLDEARTEMRLDEFRPRVLTSFVRNELLDRVYLPLIGDNLAKQIGTAGDQKRTDRMGMLLLVSPPGYGKTTLMEYIANRLGIIFMKINGPAIGHGVTSLDPAAADNSAAREELQKLNLAFEMGDNVMIYLDDIQHCNPEFLQKFISLCDAQRKIEGIYKGRPRTYDFRGRKVAVVMAGNPYTESGEKFQIPDMLSNRADIYNLGELVGKHTDAFENSYLENCLTSNPILNKLASRSQTDVRAVIRVAQQGDAAGVEFEGNYAADEMNEMVSTMTRLLKVRDVVLAVNREYIRSAAQSDDYRTEPPFKLQGSYRNMNRIAEKVVPIMNDEELTGLILASYQNDAQTLTSDMEANLLKFREMMSLLTEQEQERWDSIRETFQRNNRLRGVGDQDRVGQVVLEMSEFNSGLNRLSHELTRGFGELVDSRQANDSDEMAADERSLGAEECQQLLQPLVTALQEIRDQVAQFSSRPPATENDSAAVLPTAVQARTPTPVPVIDDASKTAISSSASIDDEQRRLTVVNRMPRSFLNVVEEQFSLMNTWLKSLSDAQSRQMSESEELQSAMSRCLQSYNVLLKRLGRKS